jgi:glycosyltransferase involved in cell wall biosynthesis
VNATMPSPRLEEREAVRAARHAAAATIAAAEARCRDTIAIAAREAADALEAERARTAAVVHELADARAETAAARAETAAVRDELTRLASGRAVRIVLPMLWRARQAALPEHSVRLRLVRRLLGRTPAAAGDVPDAAAIGDGHELSVVVLALGAPPTVVDAVRSLRTQQPEPEIVVVASGAGSERVAGLLREAGLDVPVVSTSRRLLPGAARNVGIAATHGRWIAFLAADCIAAPGWVAGRLAAHRAGADVAASAVVPPRRWNPWATATQVLLFSARLPGTPPPARQLYGASYARALFTRHGRFRPDLRAGEDSELHQRLGGDARFVFRGDVRAIHRHPTTAADFLRDQHRRGQRMARAHAALGSVTPGHVASNALGRVFASFRATARATPARDWLPLLWSTPWLLPGAAAYAAGALSAPATRAPAAPAPRRRLVCVLQFHDERRFLPGFLATVAPHVDGILALDDGSTDGSAELLEGHPRVLELLRIAPRTPHVWDEPRNKRLLLDAAARHGAEWVIALDADERVERDFRARADAVIDDADREGHLAFAVHLRELWNSPTQYRADGIWGRKRVPRLFRLLPDHDPGDAELHGPWAPNQGRAADGSFRIADLIVYHARMIDPADREARRRRYETLDPDCRWQAIGYAYLTDETGIVLEDVPADRAPLPDVDADAR